MKTDSKRPGFMTLLYMDNCHYESYRVRKFVLHEQLPKCSIYPFLIRYWERLYSHGNDFIHMGTTLLKFYTQLTEAQPSTPPSPTSPGSAADPRYIPSQLLRGTQTTAME